MSTATTVTPAIKSVRFTLDEAQAAGDAWRFNCGPAALCAVLGMTPAEIRPHLGDFEAKGYTNPTLMAQILLRLGVRSRLIYRGEAPSARESWPTFGLVRVQFAGPWTAPGVPMAVRYLKTHYVGVRTNPARRAAFGSSRPDASVLDIFDVNAMCAGGWLSWAEWSDELLPWLIREGHPKADGQWWPTHSLEVDLAGWTAPAPRTHSKLW